MKCPRCGFDGPGSEGAGTHGCHPPRPMGLEPPTSYVLPPEPYAYGKEPWYTTGNPLPRGTPDGAWEGD